MVRIEFKHAVLFNPQRGSSLTKPVQFARGVHEVDDEILAHPYFEKLHAAGSVAESSKEPVPAPETFAERGKRLSEMMAKARSSTKPAHLPTGAELPPEVKEAAAELEGGHEHEAEDEKSSEKHKKGNKRR